MKILLLSVQFKTTKKRVLNWKKKFSQKLIFLNFNILKVQNITYVNGKCQKLWSKLSACLYIYIYYTLVYGSNIISLVERNASALLFYIIIIYLIFLSQTLSLFYAILLSTSYLYLSLNIYQNLG